MLAVVHTGDDDIDGELDLPVGPRGRHGDVVPRVLLREELEGTGAGRLVGILQAVSVSEIEGGSVSFIIFQYGG